MPVLVTAAASPVGHCLVARLLATGGEVRAFCTDADRAAPLRRSGAVVACGDLLDEGHLEAAMAGVHTVVHLGAGPLVPDAQRIVEEAATVATAALTAHARRLVALSVAGARPDAADAYRRALGEVEDLVRRVPVPTVVLRTSLVDTAELRDALASVRPDAGALQQPVAPVRPDDVAAVAAAVDAARSTAAEGHAVLSVEGPDRMPLSAYLERVGIAAPGRVGRLIGRVWRPPHEVALLVEALRGRWVEDASWVADGCEFAAVTPQPVGAEDGSP